MQHACWPGMNWLQRRRARPRARSRVTSHKPRQTTISRSTSPSRCLSRLPNKSASGFAANANDMIDRSRWRSKHGTTGCTRSNTRPRRSSPTVEGLSEAEMKSQTHTKRHKPTGSPLRALALRACACGFAIYFLFILLLLAPISLAAQSGRKRPEPSPTPQTPNSQRPRRAATEAPHKPPADQPGQPATPDEPRGTPSPTPMLVLTNDPDTGQPVEIDPDEVIRVNSNLVPIPASVIDDLGRAITDLEVKDFELRVDGQPKPIGDLSRAETPVRLALLFDNSYSLRTARELEKQSAMRFFRTVMRPADQAAIYSVTTEPILEQPLTNDVNRLVHIIERYGEPEGATALLDTIVEAADYLKPQTGRKVIVIVSDGVDTVSNTEFNETV